MADGTVAVNPSTASTAVDIDNSAFGSTTFRQRVVIGGDSSAQILSPSSAAPSSGDYSIPVRLNAGASSFNIGTVLGSSLSVSTIYSSSSSPHVVLLSTAAGSSYLDPRQATIIAAGSSINVGVVPAGSSSNVFGTVYLGAGSSGNIVGSVTLAAASTAVVHGAVMLAAGSTATTMGSVALLGGTTANTIGTVAQSTTYRVQTRNFDDSTGNYNLKYFYSTAASTAGITAALMTFHQVTNLSSGSSGNSFNVASGKIFRIEYINCSLRGTSGGVLWADFAIRANSATGGSTPSHTPVWQQRLATAPPTTAALGGGVSMSQQGLTLDLPSTASYGVTVIANSSVTNEVTFSFGGIEYTI